MHHKLAMTPDHAVNVFDTPLGMRRPPPAQRTFLQNFVSVICEDFRCFRSESAAGAGRSDDR